MRTSACHPKSGIPLVVYTYIHPESSLLVCPSPCDVPMISSADCVHQPLDPLPEHQSHHCISVGTQPCYLCPTCTWENVPLPILIMSCLLSLKSSECLWTCLCISKSPPLLIFIFHSSSERALPYRPGDRHGGSTFSIFPPVTVSFLNSFLFKVPFLPCKWYANRPWGYFSTCIISSSCLSFDFNLFETREYTI
jgi:hypothetical protein